jgi:hypothetical protein
MNKCPDCGTIYRIQGEEAPYVRALCKCEETTCEHCEKIAIQAQFISDPNAPMYYWCVDHGKDEYFTEEQREIGKPPPYDPRLDLDPIWVQCHCGYACWMKDRTWVELSPAYWTSTCPECNQHGPSKYFTKEEKENGVV